MENLLLSLNVIAPIFLMLSLGFFLNKIKLLDSRTKDVMDSVCFKVFFPILLFNSIYKTDIATSFNPKLIIFAICSLLILFLLLCLIIPLIEKDSSKRGVLIQGIFRSNFVIFGLPIATALCGTENLGTVSILIAVIVPLYNALSVVALEMHRSGKIEVVKILKGVVTNPLIIGGAAGVIALLIKLPLPSAVESTISSVSAIATPLALILLGASFKFGEIRANLKQVIIGVMGKLVIVPIIYIPIAVAFGFRETELAALVVMIGAPTAVSTYAMAGQMGGDRSLAGQLVVFDSIGSIVTMFLWIFILKQMALF